MIPNTRYIRRYYRKGIVYTLYDTTTTSLNTVKAFDSSLEKYHRNWDIEIVWYKLSFCHYSDVMKASWRFKSAATRRLVKQLFRLITAETSKPRIFVRGSTDDRWILSQKNCYAESVFTSWRHNVTTTHTDSKRHPGLHGVRFIIHCNNTWKLR